MKIPFRKIKSKKTECQLKYRYYIHHLKSAITYLDPAKEDEESKQSLSSSF